MPIRPDLRKHYGKQWREETRKRILLRAGNKCEQCGVPNHTYVIRACGWWTAQIDTSRLHFMRGRQTELPDQFYWTPPTGQAAQLLGFPRTICREVYIRLGVAHLNHTAGDDRDENLRAVCQWCHLNLDKEHHRKTRQTRKDSARPLFQELGPPGAIELGAWLKQFGDLK
jgi:hypothetical protein